MIRLLQISLTEIDPQQVKVVSDSLQAVHDNMIQELKTNPQGFMHDLLDRFVDFGLKLLAAVAIYVIGAWIIGRIKKALQKLFARRGTEGTVATFLVSLVTILLTVVLIVATIGALGVNTTSIAALLAAGGIAIGMALSGTIENVAGGLMLLMFKPFKAGDFIDAQGCTGRVIELTIFSTKIRTPDNRIVIIPNGALSNGNIDNYSTNAIRRIDLNVNVAYGTDAEKCIAVLQQIASADERVIGAEHEGAQFPFAAMTSMNASDVSFMLRIWVRSVDYWDVKFALTQAIYTQLPKHGIQFDYPHMDVTIKN